MSLINELNRLGFTPEEYVDQIYDSGSYNSGGNHYINSDIELVVGPWEEVLNEQVDEEPSEANDWNTITQRIVLYFPKYDKYILSTNFQGSYGRETFTAWKEVEKKTKTIHYYE